MIALYIIGVYIIGFLITLTFLKFFGKALKLTAEHYNWNDDVEGYTVLSCIWPVSISVAITRSIVKLVQKFTKWYINL